MVDTFNIPSVNDDALSVRLVAVPITQIRLVELNCRNKVSAMEALADIYFRIENLY